MSTGKKKKKKSLAFRNGVAGYLFIAPFILGFLMFLVIPLVQSVQMSLSNVTIGSKNGGFIMEFTGLDNFKNAFFVDPEFNRILVSEITRMVFNLPATLIFSFFIALLLNQTFKGRGLVRAIFFLPVILSSGVIVGVEYNNDLVQGMKVLMKDTSSVGNITTVLQDILVTNGGVASDVFGYVFMIVNRVYDIAIASGIQIIIFLSGLQTISPSMFEAAKIEGCTAWECFWKITFPMVSSLILVNVIYTIIDFFVKSDNAVMEKIAQESIEKMQYGFSSAMAWIYFGCVLVIIGLLSAIISKRVYYYE